MPTTPGLPRGGTQVPVVPQPLLGDQGPSVLERSLGQGGELVQQVGQLGLHAADLQRRQQHAQDVLDATLAEQTWAQAHQEEVATLEQGDYRTLPKDVLATGHRLLEQVARDRTLSPQARAMYQARVQERLTLAQQRALKLQGARRDEDATLAMSNALHETQQRVAQATDPLERQVALGQFDELAQRGVAAGLFQGAAVAEARAKMLQAIEVQRLETAVQADPEGMAVQLRTQARLAAGMAGPDERLREDLPTAPSEQLARLSQLATEVSWGRVQRGWAVERDAERRYEETQKAMEANIIARLSVLDPMPQNVRALDSLVTEVNRAAQGEHPAIRHEAQLPLLRAIQSMKDAALAPRALDDEATATKLTLQIDAADNAAQLEQTRMAVFQAAPQLKRSTVSTMLNTIRERTEASHYSNVKGFRDGMAILLGADTNEAAYFAWMRQAADAETEARQRRAIDLFRATMQRLTRESPAQANAQGTQIATEIRDAYILKPQREGDLKALVQQAPTLAGPDGQGLLDAAQARAAIQQLPYLPDAERQRLFDQWQDWARRQQPVAPAPPPAPTPSFWQRVNPWGGAASPRPQTAPSPTPAPPAAAGQPPSGARPLRRVPVQ